MFRFNTLILHIKLRLYLLVCKLCTANVSNYPLPTLRLFCTWYEESSPGHLREVLECVTGGRHVEDWRSHTWFPQRGMNLELCSDGIDYHRAQTYVREEPAVSYR
jgi:hypothetical protein